MNSSQPCRKTAAATRRCKKKKNWNPKHARMIECVDSDAVGSSRGSRVNDTDHTVFAIFIFWTHFCRHHLDPMQPPLPIIFISKLKFFLSHFHCWRSLILSGFSFFMHFQNWMQSGEETFFQFAIMSHSCFSNLHIFLKMVSGLMFHIQCDILQMSIFEDSICNEKHWFTNKGNKAQRHFAFWIFNESLKLLLIGWRLHGWWLQCNDVTRSSHVRLVGLVAVTRGGSSFAFVARRNHHHAANNQPRLPLPSRKRFSTDETSFPCSCCS